MRQIKEAKEPNRHLLEDLWLADDKPDVDKLKDHLFAEGRLKKDDAVKIIKLATELFRKEPNLLEVPQPVTGNRA